MAWNVGEKVTAAKLNRNIGASLAALVRLEDESGREITVRPLRLSMPTQAELSMELAVNKADDTLAFFQRAMAKKVSVTVSSGGTGFRVQSYLRSFRRNVAWGDIMTDSVVFTTTGPMIIDSPIRPSQESPGRSTRRSSPSARRRSRSAMEILESVERRIELE